MPEIAKNWQVLTSVFLYIERQMSKIAKNGKKIIDSELKVANFGI